MVSARSLWRAQTLKPLPRPAGGVLKPPNMAQAPNISHKEAKDAKENEEILLNQLYLPRSSRLCAFVSDF